MPLVCAHNILWFLSQEETKQTVRSNALSFLHAVLPEEPGLLHRGGDGGGDCQRVRGDEHVRMQYASVFLCSEMRRWEGNGGREKVEAVERREQRVRLWKERGQEESWAKCVREQHNRAPQGWVQQTISSIQESQRVMWWNLTDMSHMSTMSMCVCKKQRHREHVYYCKHICKNQHRQEEKLHVAGMEKENSKGRSTLLHFMLMDQNPRAQPSPPNLAPFYSIIKQEKHS